eukprot:UN23168
MRIGLTSEIDTIFDQPPLKQDSPSISSEKSACCENIPNENQKNNTKEETHGGHRESLVKIDGNEIGAKMEIRRPHSL